VGFVAKFTSETGSPDFVLAERAYSRAFHEINVVEIGPKIKLRNKTIACAAFLQIGKADPTRDQVHGMGI
jgi:hypothetical protein